MVRKIIFYRHGERSDNAPIHRRIPHDIIHDPPLTDLGHLEAEAAAVSLYSLLQQSASIKLVSSPLLRCVQTISKLSQKLGLPVHLQDGFGEAFQRDFERPYDNLHVRHKKDEFTVEAQLIEEEYSYRMERAETLEDSVERMRRVAMKYFQGVQEEILVVCTHLYVIWGVALMIGEEVDKENFIYTQIFEFEYSDEGLKLVRKAVTDHLEEVYKRNS